MPQINDQALYDAIYEAARARFAQANQIEPHLETIGEGAPLYRYVGYRNSLPQAGEAGRTVWSSLANDTQNRWTGNNGDGEGHRGLYLSGEYLDTDVPFPELDHYMDHEAPPDNQVYYYQYEQGEAPQLSLAESSQLRSMFLFSATAERQGINLELDAEGNHPLLQQILEDAIEANDGLIPEGTTLQDLYTAENADFCRAIGNAVLEETELGYFRTTSVRDGVSTNVIYRAEGANDAPSVLADLRPEGRASFMMREGGVEGVTTMLDLQYNAAFEPVELAGLGILPRNVQLQQLNDLGIQMANNLAENYGEMLSVIPPNEALEGVGIRIQTLQTRLADGNIDGAVQQMVQIRQDIQGALGPEIEPQVRQTLNLVDGAVEGLAGITDAIAQVQAEPVNPDEMDNVDLAEPEPDQFDPEFEAHAEPM